MKSKVVWALAVINGLLLLTLVGQWLRPATAVAQVPRPSDYILIPGTIQASASQLVYLIDTQNGWLSARYFDGQVFQDMAPIPLNRVFNQGPNNNGRRIRGQ